MVSDQQSLQDRIANLKEFRDLWVELMEFVAQIGSSQSLKPADEIAYRQRINRIVRMQPSVQADIDRHGPRVVKPVLLGRGLYGKVDYYDPFLNIATTAPSLHDVLAHGRMGAREFFDDWSLGDRMLVRTLGALEYAQQVGGEENLPGQQDTPSALVEVLSAIRRALRPAFKEAPADEKKVQDQVEVILRAQGVRFERESQMEHSTKKVKPDFVLPALNTALEVKFCKSVEREKQIIEEIGADIVAYRKQYPIVLFVVYDVATIADKETFVRGFSRESGVLIEIIS